MRWQRGTSDADIEDRRASGGGGFRRFPGGGGLRLGLGGLIVVGILSLVFKQNFFALLGDLPADTSMTQPEAPGAPASTTAEEDERFEFVKFVLNDVQDTWTSVLPKETNSQYPRATLVVFRGAVESACGFAESASGPFYCPGDQKVYIDLSFYDELHSRFGASGDFAQAYVIAHEIGHHVQNVLGIDDQMRRAQQQRPDQANAAVGAPRAAGRLPGGRVGPLDRAAQSARAGRRRGGPERGRGDRRRPDPEQVRARRAPREVHARLVGAARRVVQARPRVRPDGRLRHVRAVECQRPFVPLGSAPAHRQEQLPHPRWRKRKIPSSWRRISGCASRPSGSSGSR